MALCGKPATHRYTGFDGKELYICRHHADVIRRVVQITGFNWDIEELSEDEKMVGMFCQEEAL